jgi:hypothetical protein
MEIEKEEPTFTEPPNALSLGVMLIVPYIAYASILIMQGNWIPLIFQKLYHHDQHACNILI